MSPPLTAGTRLVALLGDPVDHSLSPLLQNAAFRAAGVDGVYLALRCDSAALAGLLRGIALAGGAGNVSVPHKAAALAALDCRTAAVERTGACNAFWEAGGRIWGDNTDVTGIARAVCDLLGRPPRDARALVVGAGGAAAAALAALLEGGAAEVVLLNRTRSGAEALRQRFRDADRAIRVVEREEEVSGTEFDLAINATTLGMRPDDRLPLSDRGPALRAGLDLVYRPSETEWVGELRRRGLPAADGLGVLHYQGAAAFERWWNLPAPLEAMRAALPHRLPHGAPQPAPHPR